MTEVPLVMSGLWHDTSLLDLAGHSPGLFLFKAVHQIFDLSQRRHFINQR